MLIMFVAGIRPAIAAPAEQPAGVQTFNALVGHEIFTVKGEKSTWQATRFYPESITVNVGDSVNWKHDSGVEPHTVTLLGPDGMFPQAFLPPTGPGPNGGPPNIEINPAVAFASGANTYDGSAYVNSGLMAADIPGPKEYKLTFTKAGTYKFVCMIHAVQLPDGTIIGMQGSVTVQAAGAALPKTPAQVMADAQAMTAADEAAAMAEEPKAKESVVTTKPGPDGTMIHHVNTGYQLPVGELGAILDYERFSPEDIEISAGDTVEWSSPTPHSFHDVIFGDEPEGFLIEPQPAGPPKVFINAAVAFPMGSNVHTGTGVYGSGTIGGPEDPPEVGIPSYSLTFAETGRYEYICAYHYHNGMDGTVVVSARTGGGTPGMPSTGNGDNTLPLLALVTGLVLASAGVGLRLRKVAR
jgi:plastocyanin